MTTKLEGTLRREIAIRGRPYTVTITPQGVKLVPKGKRRGYELEWEAFISGEAALATALNASLARGPKVPATAEQKPIATKRKAAAGRREPSAGRGEPITAARRPPRPKAKKVRGARRS